MSVRGKTFAGDIAIDTISFSPGRCSGVPSQEPVVGINNNKVPAHALVLGMYLQYISVYSIQKYEQI